MFLAESKHAKVLRLREFVTGGKGIPVLLEQGWDLEEAGEMSRGQTILALDLTLSLSLKVVGRPR